MKKAVAIYAVIIGAGMLCMWLFFIATGSVGEFETKPAEIALHLAAEFGTAALLLASGILSLKNRPLGRPLLLAALGMLLYTVIVSPGYYVQRGEVPFAVMFFVLIILTAISIGYTAADAAKGRKS